MGWKDKVETVKVVEKVKKNAKERAVDKGAEPNLGGGKKAMLPQVMEAASIEPAEIKVIVHLLEEAAMVKDKIGVKPDPRKGVEGRGLLKEEYDLKDELGVMAAMHGVEGFRHNRIVYTQRWNEGRSSLVQAKLKELLLAEGLQADVIARVIEDATKTGDGFYTREVEVLEEK